MDDAKQATAGGKRRRLGRGLGSLISVPIDVSSAPAAPPPTSSPDPSPASDVSAAESAAAARGDVIEVPIQSLSPNPRQPRRHFDESALAALASSIRTAGLMQPIVVRPSPSRSGHFEIVAGERRYRAAQRLELERIPAIVREIDDRTAAEWALIENLQREDLNPMERARAFLALVDEFELSHQEIAEQVGLDRSSVSNLLRLNDLDPKTGAIVERGLLGLGHAKALLGCPDANLRATLAEEAVRKGWSVRQTEARVRAAEATRPTSASSAPSRPGSAHLADLERRIGEHLGTRVQLQRGRNRTSGRVVIEWYDLDQFEGLLRRMGFSGADGGPD